MHHIAYLSSAVTEFTKPQLRDLLERSRKNNDALNITGLLLYRGGNFMQVIEGDEKSVRSLYDKLSKDPRHKGIFKLFDEPVPDREFPEWSMAFQDLEVEDCSQVPGFSDFLELSWTTAGQPIAGSKARKLLAGFRDRLR